jgi:hypothetical protein
MMDIEATKIINEVMIKKYPEYSQEFMNCFRIHINIMLGKNIIKEIQTY